MKNEEMTYRRSFAKDRTDLTNRLCQSPITFEIVAKVYGAKPDLHSDYGRAVFFSTWALLAKEWYAAMQQQAHESLLEAYQKAEEARHAIG